METTNCDKIIVESWSDVTASANCFEYYAGFATQLWGEQILMSGPLLDCTPRELVGVYAQIVPWNFPLLMAARKNVVVNLNPQPFDWYGRWPAVPEP